MVDVRVANEWGFVYLCAGGGDIPDDWVDGPVPTVQRGGGGLWLRLLTRSKASTTTWDVQVSEVRPTVDVDTWDAVGEVSWGWAEGSVELYDGDGAMVLHVDPLGTSGRVRFASHDATDRFLLQLWPTPDSEPDAVLKDSSAWLVKDSLSPFEQRLAELPWSMLSAAQLVAVRAALTAHDIPVDQPPISAALELIDRIIALRGTHESGFPAPPASTRAQLLEDRTRIGEDLVPVFEALEGQIQARMASYPTTNDMEVHRRLLDEPVWRRLQALRALQGLLFQPIPPETFPLIQWSASQSVMLTARAAAPETWGDTETAILAVIGLGTGGAGGSRAPSPEDR